ncbi:MAG: hypothetical protein EOO67_04365 [Microbacterium sp.]|nr:MAG: hypothetical protein EOO67_04365 [Microbacterium sp.]
MPPLTAATEVAAYRIVIEALTNVARHADASRASVSLRQQEGSLLLEVRDDGASAVPWTPGVGISSMRERATQVGGTLRTTSGPSGSVVEATIPHFSE